MSHNPMTDLAEALARLDEQKVEELISSRFKNNADPLSIVDEMSAGMDEVGRLYKEGEYYLSELVFSADIFKKAMSRLQPLIAAGGGKESAGTIVLGTVKDDIHDLGKNIVATLLECAGFTVKDVGVDAPPEAFVDALKSTGAPLLGLSILLTTAFGSLESTISAVREAGLRDRVKIMIGGAVTNEAIREKMGADYYGADAAAAVDLAKAVFLEGKRNTENSDAG